MAPSIAQDSFRAGAGNTARFDSFHNLVSDLSRILGPSSGLNSEEVNVQELFKLIENCISSEKEWSKYALSDLSRGYTRNLVDEGNGKSNLVSLVSKFRQAIIWLCNKKLVLVWTPGKGSPVHDHADAHCLMKVLKGTLKETRFGFPKNNATPPIVIKETIYRENQVTYMADELGLHKISNPDSENVAVSLHRMFSIPCWWSEGAKLTMK